MNIDSRSTKKGKKRRNVSCGDLACLAEHFQLFIRPCHESAEKVEYRTEFGAPFDGSNVVRVGERDGDEAAWRRKGSTTGKTGPLLKNRPRRPMKKKKTKNKRQYEGLVD